MFTNILLGAADSEACAGAAGFAATLARKHGAKLTVLHCGGLEQHPDGPLLRLPPTTERDKAGERVAARFEPLLSGVPYTLEVRRGFPHVEIAKAARRLDTDLIVLGAPTGGKDDLQAYGLGGSSIQKVCRTAACPVLLVARDFDASAGFQNIVAATDFSEQSDCALAYAARLAGYFGATLHLFHVLRLEGDTLGPGPRTMERLIREARERMAYVCWGLLDAVESCSFDVREGEPVLEILKYAREKQADLLVMAHHDTATDPEEAMKRSVTAKVALQAGCPTLNVNKRFDPRCGLA